MDEDVTTIHITEVPSSFMIMNLLEKYPNLEKITCSPSVYNRTSDTYIEALNQLDIEVVKEYHWGASKKPCDYEDELLELASEGYKAREIAEILNIGTTEDGFIKESHPKIKPVATDVQGIFVCGTAQDPKDITESIMQATASASKVSEYNYGGVEIEPFIAEIDKEKCILCGDCIIRCKYKSMSIQNDEVYIDPMACTGCGKCLVGCVCPLERRACCAVCRSVIPSIKRISCSGWSR